MGKSKIKPASVLSAVLAVAVIVAVIAVVAKYTNIIPDIEDIADGTVRVEYDGKSYTGADNYVVLPSDGKASFNVRGNSGGYTVKVMPNVTSASDIVYTANGKLHRFSQARLTETFITADVKKNGVFEIDCTKDNTLGGVLSRLHGHEVENDADIAYPYKLTITANNGGEIVIRFNCGPVTDIELSVDEIIF